MLQFWYRFQRSRGYLGTTRSTISERPNTHHPFGNSFPSPISTGQVVQVARERVGVWLRLVVVVHAGQVLPARVSAHLDQSRSKLPRPAHGKVDKGTAVSGAHGHRGGTPVTSRSFAPLGQVKHPVYPKSETEIRAARRGSRKSVHQARRPTRDRAETRVVLRTRYTGSGGSGTSHSGQQRTRGQNISR